MSGFASHESVLKEWTKIVIDTSATTAFMTRKPVPPTHTSYLTRAWAVHVACKYQDCWLPHTLRVNPTLDLWGGAHMCLMWQEVKIKLAECRKTTESHPNGQWIPREVDATSFQLAFFQNAGASRTTCKQNPHLVIATDLICRVADSELAQANSCGMRGLHEQPFYTKMAAAAPLAAQDQARPCWYKSSVA
jgi:hypothetical protein